MTRTDNKSTPITRREFIKDAGILSSSAFLLTFFPWLQSCSREERRDIDHAKIRIALIGTGSRGQYHLQNLQKMPNVEVVALCDDYEPHLQAASAFYPNARTYSDYRRLLEQSDVQGVIVATPLNWHAPITIAALQSGKHVFCEKSMALTLDDCKAMYDTYKSSGKVMFIGQQRLFDPKYIRAMEMVHTGLIGQVTGIRAYWYRNNDWRRPVPSPELERRINWRLYKATSGGLVTELATHQLQVGNWATRMIPTEVFGFGDLVYWKEDHREVPDSVSLVYRYPNGVKMTYESVISNKHFGLEEAILGHKGTIEPEQGKYYFEEAKPAPGIMQLINDIEHGIFDKLSFASPSWVPETAENRSGYFILDKVSTVDGASSVGFADDGSEQLMRAFVDAVATGRPAPNLVEEAYYSSVLGVLGLQAIDEGRLIKFPDQYKIPYLNFA